MKLTLVILLSIFCLLSKAQPPVQWAYSAKKLDKKTYEVTMSAAIQRPWHLYSQTTPDGGPLPSEVHFGKNPLIEMDGKTAEKGNKIQRREEVFGIDVQYYEGKVDFVQKVKLKASVKTNIQGTIKYMVCNDKECLPPKTETFSIDLK